CRRKLLVIAVRSIDSETSRTTVDNRRQNNKRRFMKNLFRTVNNRVAAVALGGAVILAGSALAFTQKPKAEPFTAPTVDERPLTRELGGHTSFAPVVKKVAPAVVKV